MGMSGFKSNGEYDAWTRTVIKTQTEDVKAAIQSGDWNIKAIENLDYTTCMYIAEDVEMVKEHTVFFIDFGKFFGYSAIVFYGNAHIYHASDYELHHKSLEGDKKSLKEFYIKALNNKLFTDDELINSAPKSYDELGRRRNFLTNYIGQRMNHVSFFHIFNDEKVAEAYTRETKNLYRSDVAYAFYTRKSISVTFKVSEDDEGICVTGFYGTEIKEYHYDETKTCVTFPEEDKVLIGNWHKAQDIIVTFITKNGKTREKNADCCNPIPKNFLYSMEEIIDPEEIPGFTFGTPGWVDDEGNLFNPSMLKKGNLTLYSKLYTEIKGSTSIFKDRNIMIPFVVWMCDHPVTQGEYIAVMNNFKNEIDLDAIEEVIENDFLNIQKKE